MLVLKKLPRKIPTNIGFTPILGEKKIIIISTASGALVVGGVRDIYSSMTPDIGLSVQWSRSNQSVAVCGSLCRPD